MSANRNMYRVMLHKCRAGYKEVTDFRLQKNFLYSCDIIENFTIGLNCNQSDILRQRTHDVQLKEYCVKLLEKFGSLSYTRQTLEEIDDEARAEVAKLGGNQMLQDLLDEMLEWKRWTDDNKPEE
jgi:geranylgeranyl pyrophosphate synthase